MPSSILRTGADINILLRLANNIKEIRKGKDISQKELADLCGIQKATMSRIEGGKCNITVLTLYCIAMALQVGLKQLLTGVF